MYFVWIQPLLDASSEFKAFFDDVIKSVHSKIKPESLSDFNQRWTASGEPRFICTRTRRLQKMRAVKIQVLEVVWLTSTAPRRKAWQSLSEMWRRRCGEDSRGKF